VTCTVASLPVNRNVGLRHGRLSAPITHGAVHPGRRAGGRRLLSTSVLTPVFASREMDEHQGSAPCIPVWKTGVYLSTLRKHARLAKTMRVRRPGVPRSGSWNLKATKRHSETVVSRRLVEVGNTNGSSRTNRPPATRPRSESPPTKLTWKRWGTRRS